MTDVNLSSCTRRRSAWRAKFVPGTTARGEVVNEAGKIKCVMRGKAVKAK